MAYPYGPSCSVGWGRRNISAHSLRLTRATQHNNNQQKKVAKLDSKLEGLAPENEMRLNISWRTCVRRQEGKWGLSMCRVVWGNAFSHVRWDGTAQCLKPRNGAAQGDIWSLVSMPGKTGQSIKGCGGSMGSQGEGNKEGPVLVINLRALSEISNY